MDTFQVVSKLWPSGASLDLGDDTNNVTVPSSFTRHAANFVSSMDGTTQYQFLFWNTGRHLTNKRHVLWNFSVGGWGLWTATRWYGTPSGLPPGPPRVHADGFALAANGPLGTDTPINNTASTFPPGAWPFNANDHEIGTANGPVTVVAKNPFHSLTFAGWLQLMWGGDDSGTYVETDTGSAMSSSSFFDEAGSAPFSAGQNTSADLLATYGNSSSSITHIPWGEIFKGLGLGNGPIGPGDPAPDDLIRLALIEQLLAKTRPGDPGAVGVDIRRIIQEAPGMSLDELKRAKSSLQTSLDLGKTALNTLDAQIKQRG